MIQLMLKVAIRMGLRARIAMSASKVIRIVTEEIRVQIETDGHSATLVRAKLELPELVGYAGVERRVQSEFADLLRSGWFEIACQDFQMEGPRVDDPDFDWEACVFAKKDA